MANAAMCRDDGLGNVDIVISDCRQTTATLVTDLVAQLVPVDGKHSVFLCTSAMRLEVLRFRASRHRTLRSAAYSFPGLLLTACSFHAAQIQSVDWQTRG